MGTSIYFCIYVGILFYNRHWVDPTLCQVTPWKYANYFIHQGLNLNILFGKVNHGRGNAMTHSELVVGFYRNKELIQKAKTTL